jgi:putative endopeptidase
MPRLTLSAVASFALASAACASGDRSIPTTPTAPTATVHSIDLAAIDLETRPGTDFFMHANGAWFKKAEIAPDRGGTGVDLRISEEVEKRTREILEKLAKGGAPASSTSQKIADFYATYLDEAAIEARGTAPLAPALERIAKVTDVHALASLLGEQLRADIDPINATSFYTDHLFGLFVEQDVADPTRYAPYLLQGGLGMPDRSFYVDTTARMKELRAKYEHHVSAMLTLAGITDADAKATRIVQLETKIAQAHVSRVDSEDIAKANNPWPRSEFGGRAPGLDWDAFFAAAHLDKLTTFVVWHPHAVTGIAALVASEPLDTWKEYLTLRVIEHEAATLPKAFFDERFAFFGRELRGMLASPPRWRRALDATNDALGDAVGKLYVESYFPPENKRRIEQMVTTLEGAFARRIDALPWMAPVTKAKAKEKLSTLRVGIGYPDKWRDYSDFTVVRGDAVGNAERAELFEYRRCVAKLGQPIDRDAWSMLPQVVDAVNMPIRNAIDFPAGILTAPYFDARSTAAANYGAIGAVIGHEISHSFDDQGSKFDAQGRLASWWTPEDLAHFTASGIALAAQFSAYKPFPDAAVDGTLTLSENIADLAGLAAAYDAWRASLGGAAAPEQDALTGDQQFFLAYAQSWQSKDRNAVLRERLATDGHAPARYRALTVRNLDAWYTAFDVKDSDKLYLAPEARVRIW